MPWTVIATPEFSEWLAGQPLVVRERLRAAFLLVETYGPHLGRPHVDTLKGSSLPNLKELRLPIDGSPYRVLFAFDPVRRAVMLCGGNKAGDKQFYKRMIRQAEQAFAAYLRATETPPPGDAE